MLLKPRPVPVLQNLHVPSVRQYLILLSHVRKILCHQNQKSDKNNGCFPITAQETATLRKLLTKVKGFRIYFDGIISKKPETFILIPDLTKPTL